MPEPEKARELVILEFKRMSDVTEQYVGKAHRVAVAQYASIKSALEQKQFPQGWLVSQRSFTAGARSLNEEDLSNNLACFQVQKAGIESIRSKLAFKIFDEYARKSWESPYPSNTPRGATACSGCMRERRPSVRQAER